MATPEDQQRGMLFYDHDRTEKIVERLRNAERVIRLIAVVASVTLFAFAGTSIARSTDGPLIGGVVGAVIGFGVGTLSMVPVSAVVEWMCQILIAQGEIIEAAKRGHEKISRHRQTRRRSG